MYVRRSGTPEYSVLQCTSCKTTYSNIIRHTTLHSMSRCAPVIWCHWHGVLFPQRWCCSLMLSELDAPRFCFATLAGRSMGNDGEGQNTMCVRTESSGTDTRSWYWSVSLDGCWKKGESVNTPMHANGTMPLRHSYISSSRTVSS